MKQKHRDKWLDRCALELPYCYRLCVTEKEFHKELKRLKLPKSVWPPFTKPPHANATVHYFENMGEQALCAIVCMSKKEKKLRTEPAIYGLLIHEAMHIWRACREHIGEERPSEELEAYAVQRIAQNLIWSWQEQTK